MIREVAGGRVVLPDHGLVGPADAEDSDLRRHDDKRSVPPGTAEGASGVTSATRRAALSWILCTGMPAARRSEMLCAGSSYSTAA